VYANFRGTANKFCSVANLLEASGERVILLLRAELIDSRREGNFVMAVSDHTANSSLDFILHVENVFVLVERNTRLEIDNVMVAGSLARGYDNIRRRVLELLGLLGNGALEHHALTVDNNFVVVHNLIFCT